MEMGVRLPISDLTVRSNLRRSNVFKRRLTEAEDGGKLRSRKAEVKKLLGARVLSGVVEPQEDFFEDLGQTLIGAFKPFLFRK